MALEMTSDICTGAMCAEGWWPTQVHARFGSRRNVSAAQGCMCCGTSKKHGTLLGWADESQLSDRRFDRRFDGKFDGRFDGVAPGEDESQLSHEYDESQLLLSIDDD